MKVIVNDAVENYIKVHSKSQILGFVLTVLFGPLGLFYSSWVAALILCLIAIVSFSTIFVPVICWLLAIVIGFLTVRRHNQKVKATAKLGDQG